MSFSPVLSFYRAASSVLVAAGAGVTHDVTAGGVGALPGLVVSGNLTLNAGAAITQSAALSVDGSTTVNAGPNAITLNAAANNLKGAITLNNMISASTMIST